MAEKWHETYISATAYEILLKNTEINIMHMADALRLLSVEHSG
jgi:hypothetical protein